MPLEGFGKQFCRIRREIALPYRIEWGQFFFEPFGKRLRAAPIGEAAMMACDAIGADQRGKTICSLGGCQTQNLPGARCRMVWAVTDTADVVLKLTAVLAQ